MRDQDLTHRLRAIAAGVLALLWAAPALADDWQAYESAAFGYAIDVPMELGTATEAAGGFVIQNPTTTLTVFGLEIAPMDFAGAVDAALASSTDEGFNLTQQVATPDRAQFGAVNGQQRQAVGLVALCGGTIAGFELRYQEAEMLLMLPVIERLGRSLRKTGNC